LVQFHRSAKEAAATVSAIRDHGGKAHAVEQDLNVLDGPGASAWIQGLEASHGPIGLIVNNAARFEFDTPEDFSVESLQAHLNTNLRVPLLLIQAFYERLRQSEKPARRGVAIQLLDQKLLNPNPDFFSYTLSKAALSHGCELMARAFAPQLRVLSVSPGISLPSADQTQAEFERAHGQTPMGQSSRPQDIAEAVCWLAQAQAITGVNLAVDGGQHLCPSPRDILFLTRSPDHDRPA
jgi:NAD(P)-dependent dehydrogenase (short-subunit alcohol dehydrogenase family)